MLSTRVVVVFFSRKDLGVTTNRDAGDDGNRLVVQVADSQEKLANL